MEILKYTFVKSTNGSEKKSHWKLENTLELTRIKMLHIKYFGIQQKLEGISQPYSVKRLTLKSKKNFKKINKVLIQTRFRKQLWNKLRKQQKRNKNNQQLMNRIKT